MWGRKQINSDEYEKLSKKIVDLNTSLTELSAKIAVVQSDNANLRGQFNRKLSGIKKEEIGEEQKDINNPVILPYNGTFFGNR